MNQLNKNYIKYLSYTKKLKGRRVNLFLSKILKSKRRDVSNSKIISTCMVRGRLKRTYKNNHVSRHMVRDEYNNNHLKLWGVKTW